MTYVMPDDNIADIATFLSTTCGLRSLKISIDIDPMGFVPGLLPAVFGSGRLHQDLEELVVVVLRGRAPYHLEEFHGLQYFERLRCVAIDGTMEECQESSFAKFLDTVAYWFPRTLEILGCGWGEVRSTLVLNQLPWVKVFSAERDVESFDHLQHPSIEYISVDLLTALQTLQQWSVEQWEALARRCPNLKCVAWMDDLFSSPQLRVKQFQRIGGGVVRITDATVAARVFSEAPVPLWWWFSVFFRLHCRRLFLLVVDPLLVVFAQLGGGLLVRHLSWGYLYLL